MPGTLLSPFFGGGSVELALAARGWRVLSYDAFGLVVDFWQQSIILDDVDLHKDPVGVGLLQALTDSRSPRLISWDTAAPQLKTEDGPEIPTSFLTTSQILIISNHWARLGQKLAALADRGMVLQFDPTNEEIHLRAASWFTDAEIYEYIGRHLPLIGSHSLRVYGAAAELKRAGQDWRECLRRNWKLDPQESRVLQLLEQSLSQAERARRFVASGAGVERTYYNVYARIISRCPNPLQFCSAVESYVVQAGQKVPVTMEVPLQ
ncbi:MAG: hypothetical protein PCFJNLEI_01417 [Verrucomicrobiae bacterium]|nr:hypothetical protein [Verrucomicrobiae bacterium]